ncbi:hypothetical protein GCM10011402_10230 [Paracoccus acridae]|uniref:Transposase n=1 Tax=Paracoccus acridae TaxID=1795310 RepID=A0ABQ1VGS2_9RHOB|nr:hypothetical protein GCM10011402_10230 [Paracoccus acridae]
MPVPTAADNCAGSARMVRHEPATGLKAVPNEELEYVPGRFIVNRIVRPRLTCACCERFMQAPLPSRPIKRGRPGPGLLAHVLVSKYADHLPLYRQSQIFDREGLDLDRSTLADWVGKSTALLEPLAGRIAQLYADEKEARGSPPDRRAELRRAHAAPVFDELEQWLAAQLTKISGKSPLASAIRYTLARMERTRPYLEHGILELDNNAAERGMRSVALGRKNYLFVGSEAGGKAAAIAYTLVATAKLNGVDPQAWLADTLARIPDYKITKVDELLPWHWNG